MNMKSSKRWLCCALAVAMIVILAGCGVPQQNAQVSEASKEAQVSQSAAASAADTSSAQAPGKKLKVFFAYAYYSGPYAAQVVPAMEEYAAAHNVELQTVDGEGNSQKQLDQIKNAVTQGVDGIIYQPADAAATPPVVNYLKESGVPFVVWNIKADASVMNLCTYVGLDYEKQSAIAGQILKDACPNGGNIVCVQGQAGSDATNGYQSGFESVILQDSKYKVLAKQNADWDTAKAMKIMEDFITTYGD